MCLYIYIKYQNICEYLIHINGICVLYILVFRNVIFICIEKNNQDTVYERIILLSLKLRV